MALHLSTIGLCLAGSLCVAQAARAQAPARPGTALMSGSAAKPAAPLPIATVPAATAPTPAAGPAEKKPDPAFETARAVFDALAEAERRALQDALVWTGDFNGVDTGTFGRRTYDALLAYQRRAKTAPDGTLDERERTALLAAGRALRDAAGFALRLDRATGVALGVPVKALQREQALPHGTRWQSPDGRVTLETRSFAAGETDLPATFDRLVAAAPDRKITYKLKRPDFLVVTGETPTGRFYVRYADTPAGLRGFTFSYDKAVAAETDKLVIAVANSFAPQPGDAAVSAAAKPPAAPNAPALPGMAAARPANPATMSAFEVAPGRLLTSAAALAACGAARLGLAPVRVIAKNDLFALLAAPERPSTATVRLAPDPTAGDPLVVLASDGATGAVAIPGEAPAAHRVTAPLQPGSAGAPAFDHAGRLVGLVASYPSAPRLIAGVVPPAGYDLLSAGAAAAFLRDNGVAATETATGPASSVGEIASANAAAIRTLACAP